MVQAGRRQGELGLGLGLERSRKGNGKAPEMRQQLEPMVPACHPVRREGATTQFSWQ